MNGINMNIIEELAKEYSQEPQKGIQPYKANINWNNGLSAVAKVGNHDELLIDEPEWLAGTNKGPNPVEYLLSALGGCLSLSFILSANNKNHEIKGLDVEVTGDVDLNILLGLKEGNPGFYNLNVTFNVDTEIEDVKIEELMHDALSISVVGNTVQSKVQINPEYKRK